MTRTSFLLAVLLCLSAGAGFSQSPEIVWQKSLGSPNGDYTHTIRATTDGGYIIAGYTESNGGDVVGYHGNLAVGDLWIVKLSSTGNIQWQKCLGGTSKETGAEIRQTSDGGYIVGASTASRDCGMPAPKGGLDYWLVKLSPAGDIQWQKVYGGSANDYCYAMAIAADGGYILGGFSESNDEDVTGNHGMRDYWIIKTDASGNLQWQKSYGGTQDDILYGLQATPDGGCIATGYTESHDGDITGNHGSRDYWVVKVGAAGSIQWHKSMGGTHSEEGWAVQLTNDGGYVVAGYAASNDGDVSGNHLPPGDTDADFWVVKLNTAGVLQWEKCYGGFLNEIAYNIEASADGGFVVSGSAESSDGDLTCNQGLTDMWIIKINNAGTLEWQKSLGGNYYDQASFVQPLPDGSFIVAGNTCSAAVPNYHVPTNLGTCADYWIVKLSAPVAAPQQPVVSIEPASGIVCPGVPTLFTAQAANAGVSPVYRWTKNAVVVGSNSPTYNGSGLSNGDVIAVSVARGGSCDVTGLQSAASLKISVSANIIQPTATITGDNFICNCSPATFKVQVQNGGADPILQWTVNGVATGNNNTVFISTGLYPGDQVNCMYSDRAACVTNGGVFSNTIAMSSGGNAVTAVTIAASNSKICSGSSVTFTATPSNAGANPVYQWKVNSLIVGTNTSTFTSSSLSNNDVVTCTITPDPLFSCATPGNVVSNPISISISGQVAPSVAISAAATDLCVGALAMFTAVTVDAGDHPSYQWMINGVSAGTNSSSFISTALSNNDVISCVIGADPSFGCALASSAVSNTIIVSVRNQAQPSVDIIVDNNNVCAGQPVTFVATVGNAGSSITYSWSVNGTVSAGNSASFSSSTLTNGDEVVCAVIPGAGACSTTAISSNAITAVIYPLPLITVSPADTTINVGQKLSLIAKIIGTVNSYQWSPSTQLENALTLTPTSVPLSNNTTYIIAVQDNNGCMAKDSSIVKVVHLLVMPNAFTPNGDGKNDVFRIPDNVDLQLEEFSVFDRWGNRVFTTKRIDEGWTGIYRGALLNAGTFAYYIRGKNKAGLVVLKGTVVLIR